MTQAISLYQILHQHKHEVAHIFIGTSKRRRIPDYFLTAFHIPVEPIDSPNFITDRRNRSIRLIPSIIYNLKYLKKYWNSMHRIQKVIEELGPDVLINFYDFLGGVYNYLYKPPVKYFVVGHAFMTDHPSFSYARGRPMHKLLFKIYNYLNALHAYKKLALSFMPCEPLEIGKTFVMPPLLRDQLKSLKPESQDFILGYMVNEGYSDEIVKWNRKNPETCLHIFWDKKGEPEVKQVSDTLFFHQLNGEKFLKMQAKCRGIVTTAGFETICEAMYFGKPVLMVPVAGQFEQACNAIDAVKAGAGIQDDHFNISGLIEYSSEYSGVSSAFKSWHDQGWRKFLDILTVF